MFGSSNIDDFAGMNEPSRATSGFKRGLAKDFVQMILLFIASIFIVYANNGDFKFFSFLLSLIIFWFSKKDYFWFAFMTVIIFAPGGLFANSELLSDKTIPYFNITEGVSLSYFDLFFLFAFIKALPRKPHLNFSFQNEIRILLVLGAITLVYSVIRGVDQKTIVSLFRYWMPFTFVFSIPRLFKSKEDFYKMLFLISPTALIIIVFQLTLSLFNLNILTFLTGNEQFNSLYKAFSTENSSLRATNFYAENVLLNALFSIIMLTYFKQLFSKRYLYLIMILSFSTFIISGTRTWIVVLLLSIIYYLFFISKKKFGFVIKGIGFSIVLLIIATSFTSTDNLLSAALGRFSTLNTIATEGAEMDGSADSRINIRLPLVLLKFEEAPIFGQGFTPSFATAGDLVDGEYRVSPSGDPHVGNFNLLANVGVFGFVFFLYFWISILSKLSKYRKTSNIQFKEPISILILFFLVFLFVHFTSYQFFGLTQSALQNLFLVFYFVFVSIIMDESRVGMNRNFLTNTLSIKEESHD